MCTFGDILKNIIIFIPFLKLLSNVFEYESFRKVECIDIVINISITVIVISLSLSFFCYCITQHWRRKGQDKTINDTVINNLNKKRQFRKTELGKETTLKPNVLFQIEYLKSIKFECNGFQKL